MYSCLWVDHKNENAPALLAAQIQRLLAWKAIKRRLRRHPLIFLCIGTPKIPGDCLGPLVGTLLQSHIQYHVYGTLAHPVHALNLKETIRHIHHCHPGAVIIAIDAAIGSGSQNGFLTVQKGALKPGIGLGKRLPHIGHIQITGVFRQLYGANAVYQMARYSLCIARALRRGLAAGENPGISPIRNVNNPDYPF